MNYMTLKLGFFLLVMLCFQAGNVQAQKPPKGNPPPPPPNLPGIIYHYRDGNVWSVLPNGSGLTQVLPSGFKGSPNFRPQGTDVVHDRWYLEKRQTGFYSSYIDDFGNPGPGYPHYDIFAFRTSPGDRSQVESIQLTDLFGICLIAMSGDPEWSLDDNDSAQTSHVGFGYVWDISDTFILHEDGTGYFDATGKSSKSLRLPITATEVTLARLNGTHQPFRPNDEAELAATLYPHPTVHYNDLPALTPNGQHLVALQVGVVRLLNPLTAIPEFDSWNGTSMGIPTNTTQAWQNNSASLSPDSTRIALRTHGRTTLDGIWIITLDGSRPPIQLTKNSSKANTYTEFEQVIWSPDSNYVLTQKKYYSSAAGIQWDQLIIPSNGGSPVMTFSKSPMWGIRWAASE